MTAVYTIIDMATAYGTALGLDSTGLLLALLVTQIVAFPAALIFGRLSRKAQSSKLIMVCIGAYFLVALYGIILEKQYQFWILAVVVGMFPGRDPVALPLLLRKDHFPRTNPRIFRTV